MTDNPEEIIPPKNAKHRLFADLYLSGKSGVQSAIDAGYSLRTAGVQAAQMLRKPEVASYVSAMKAKVQSETGITATKWTEELSRSAFSNVDDFTRVNSDGDLEVDFTKATREQLAAIQSVKVKKRRLYDKDGNTVGEEHQSEFRLWDKMRALELLGKQAGFLKETETRVVIDVADRLLTARSRVMKGAGQMNTLSILGEDERDEERTIEGQSD